MSEVDDLPQIDEAEESGDQVDVVSLVVWHRQWAVTAGACSHTAGRAFLPLRPGLRLACEQHSEQRP